MKRNIILKYRTRIVDLLQGYVYNKTVTYSSHK